MPDFPTPNFNTLNNDLPDGEVFTPGMAEYEAAVSIGNLLYRMITPKAIVLARSIHEVQTTVRFAARHSLHLTVKNGGHSYAAYCLNQDGIVLDLKHLRKVKVDVDGNKVTIQGGAIWKDVYSRLAEYSPRKLVVGGQCPTVGVSGFTLGGGLSPFSRSYGLGVDSLLEMKIVTADGRLVTVGPDEDDDEKRELFWAVRGGGGGNFGVTVEIVSRLHELRDGAGLVVCGSLSWKLSRREEEFRGMMEVFNGTRWPRELTVDAFWHADNGRELMGDMTVVYNGSMKECMGVIEPLLRFAPDINLREMNWMDWVNQEMQGGFGTTSKIYHHHVSFIFGQGAITPEFVEDVLWLLKWAKELLSNKELFPVLADQDCESASGVHFLWDHIGEKTSEVEAEDTAFYWRKGEYVANIKLSWSHPSQSSHMLDFEKLCKAVLQRYTLNKVASYVNYIDDTEERWQDAYYGENYPRLQRVKKWWDPGNFWRFPQSIGEGLQQIPVLPPSPPLSPPLSDSRSEPQSPFPSPAAQDLPRRLREPTGQIHKRWEEFSVKNPATIQSAGHDVQRTLAANQATREHHWR
ncbi:putative FAD-linked oxidoreductase YvdP [Triangularia verruculosa]|uniref:FAD-linked oxidoreductase YvdP n=1 Tax=Triangularia verruculosa TaxID=2587418 RepID=A0AAN6X952_9PEZI|nr:putative FAD-linked oxidoreductase YvdP [Triangularia verruculosa]